MAGHSKWSEIKRRKGLTEAREQALRKARGMITSRERARFRIRCELDGALVLVRIPELELTTQARWSAEIEPMGRELIATWLDAAPDAFDLEVEVVYRRSESSHS